MHAETALVCVHRRTRMADAAGERSLAALATWSDRPAPPLHMQDGVVELSHFGGRLRTAV